MANLSNINNKFLVTTGGDVGIGTTSPDRLLDVSGIGNVYAKIQSTNSSAAGIELDTNGGSIENWLIQADEGVGGLAFYDLGRTAYRMLINSSGNVGIGNVNPATPLDVRRNDTGTAAVVTVRQEGTGDASIDFQTTTSPYGFNIGVDGSDSDKFKIASGLGDVGTNTRLTIDTSGNVGIGTVTPQKKFHIEGTGGASEMQILVSGASDTVGHTAGIGLRAEGGEADSDARIKGGIFFERIAGSFGNGKMILAVNSSVSNTSVTVADHALTIDTNKNVGIGTDSPDYPLDVESSGSNAYVFSNNTAAGGASGYRWKTPDSEFSWYSAGGTNNMNLYDYTAGAIRITVDSSGNSTFAGNVNISSPGDFYINSGTSYNNKGSIFMSNQRTEIVSDIVNLTANGDTSLNFKTRSGGATASAIFIDEFRNVGIGTATPTYKLVVSNGGASGIEFAPNALTGMNEILSYNRSGAAYEKLRFSTLSYEFYTSAVSNALVILNGGNVGIGTTNPSSELEVAGRAIVEKLEVARYSDSNAPAPVYVGRLANPMGAGGVFRLGVIQSSSTVNTIDEPFLITYSSGHWGCQPMFFAEFTITYYRGSYIKYWAQHEVSGSRLEIVDGPYGGQIISGGAPVSRTITQLCTNCHGGQPVYKCVWKWSNSGTYIKTSPIVSLVDGHGSARVYTSGSSSESAIDTLLGSAGSPGPAYLLMGIDNAQAAGFTGLQTQN